MRFPVIWLLLTASVFATNFSAIKVAVEAFPPLWLAEIRLLLGAAGLSFYLRWRGEPAAAPWREWRLTLAVAVLGFALPFSLIAWAETRASSAETGLLFCVGPLIAASFSHFMTRDDRLSPRRAIGLAVGFASGGLLYWRSAFAGSTPDPLPAAAILGTLICFAISGNLSRRLTTSSSTQLTRRALLLGAVLVLPFAMMFERGVQAAETRHLVAVLYSGAIATSVGYGLRYWIIKTQGYTYVSFLGYLMPPLSGLWGFLLLGETVPWSMWVAAGGALSGLALVGRSSSAQRRR